MRNIAVTNGHIITPPKKFTLNMPYTILMLYPNETDTTFDISYYLKGAHASGAKIWVKHGSKSWNVTEYNENYGWIEA